MHLCEIESCSCHKAHQFPVLEPLGCQSKVVKGVLPFSLLKPPWLSTLHPLVHLAYHLRVSSGRSLQSPGLSGHRMTGSESHLTCHSCAACWRRNARFGSSGLLSAAFFRPHPLKSQHPIKPSHLECPFSSPSFTSGYNRKRGRCSSIAGSTRCFFRIFVRRRSTFFADSAQTCR